MICFPRSGEELFPSNVQREIEGVVVGIFATDNNLLDKGHGSACCGADIGPVRVDRHFSEPQKGEPLLLHCGRIAGLQIGALVGIVRQEYVTDGIGAHFR